MFWQTVQPESHSAPTALSAATTTAHSSVAVMVAGHSKLASWTKLGSCSILPVIKWVTTIDGEWKPTASISHSPEPSWILRSVGCCSVLTTHKLTDSLPCPMNSAPSTRGSGKTLETVSLVRLGYKMFHGILRVNFSAAVVSLRANTPSSITGSAQERRPVFLPDTSVMIGASSPERLAN